MGAPVRRRRGLSAQAADAAVDQACRQLRLPSVRGLFADMVATAEKEQLTYQGFLAELLLAECDDRARRRSVRRVKAAGFPREKWLGDFDFEANPNINPATIHTLATSAWVRAGQPLCLIGDSVTATDCNSCVRYCRATCGLSPRRIRCSDVCWRRGRSSAGTARCCWSLRCRMARRERSVPTRRTSSVRVECRARFRC